MSQQEKTPPRGGRVEIRVPGNLEPVYVNFALITNSPSEIIIDLAQIMPRMPRAVVKARVIMTPTNAKLLHRALTEHISRFEEQYGEINMPKGTSLAGELFRPSPDDQKSEDD
ncbi:MAG: DUF3467 domain-containing protein [Chloroflexi bacterium]|nr:DUF3467 domain-containing protein [Chloroflexota bacterium]